MSVVPATFPLLRESMLGKKHSMEEWSDFNERTGEHIKTTRERTHWDNSLLNGNAQYRRLAEKKESKAPSMRKHSAQEMEVFSAQDDNKRVNVMRRQEQFSCVTAGGSSYKYSSHSSTTSSTVMGTSRGPQLQSAATNSHPAFPELDFKALETALTTLDHTPQKARGSVGRSGSAGRRRPPSRDSRKSSAASLFSDSTGSQDLPEETSTINNFFADSSTRRSRSLPRSQDLLTESSSANTLTNGRSPTLGVGRRSPSLPPDITNGQKSHVQQWVNSLDDSTVIPPLTIEELTDDDDSKSNSDTPSKTKRKLSAFDKELAEKVQKKAQQRALNNPDAKTQTPPLPKPVESKPRRSSDLGPGSSDAVNGKTVIYIGNKSKSSSALQEPEPECELKRRSFRQSFRESFKRTVDPRWLFLGEAKKEPNEKSDSAKEPTDQSNHVSQVTIQSADKLNEKVRTQIEIRLPPEGKESEEQISPRRTETPKTRGPSVYGVRKTIEQRKHSFGQYTKSASEVTNDSREKRNSIDLGSSFEKSKSLNSVENDIQSLTNESASSIYKSMSSPTLEAEKESIEKYLYGSSLGAQVSYPQRKNSVESNTSVGAKTEAPIENHTNLVTRILNKNAQFIEKSQTRNFFLQKNNSEVNSLLPSSASVPGLRSVSPTSPSVRRKIQDEIFPPQYQRGTRTPSPSKQPIIAQISESKGNTDQQRSLSVTSVGQEVRLPIPEWMRTVREKRILRERKKRDDPGIPPRSPPVSPTSGQKKTSVPPYQRMESSEMESPSVVAPWLREVRLKSPPKEAGSNVIFNSSIKGSSDLLSWNKVKEAISQSTEINTKTEETPNKIKSFDTPIVDIKIVDRTPNKSTTIKDDFRELSALKSRSKIDWDALDKKPSETKPGVTWLSGVKLRPLSVKTDFSENELIHRAPKEPIKNGFRENISNCASMEASKNEDRGKTTYFFGSPSTQRKQPTTPSQDTNTVHSSHLLQMIEDTPLLTPTLKKYNLESPTSGADTPSFKTVDVAISPIPSPSPKPVRKSSLTFVQNVQELAYTSKEEPEQQDTGSQTVAQFYGIRLTDVSTTAADHESNASISFSEHDFRGPPNQQANVPQRKTSVTFVTSNGTQTIADSDKEKPPKSILKRKSYDHILETNVTSSKVPEWIQTAQQKSRSVNWLLYEQTTSKTRASWLESIKKSQPETTERIQQKHVAFSEDTTGGTSPTFPEIPSKPTYFFGAETSPKTAHLISNLESEKEKDVVVNTSLPERQNSQPMDWNTISPCKPPSGRTSETREGRPREKVQPILFSKISSTVKRPEESVDRLSSPTRVSQIQKKFCSDFITTVSLNKDLQSFNKYFDDPKIEFSKSASLPRSRAETQEFNLKKQADIEFEEVRQNSNVETKTTDTANDSKKPEWLDLVSKKRNSGLWDSLVHDDFLKKNENGKPEEVSPGTPPPPSNPISSRNFTNSLERKTSAKPLVQTKVTVSQLRRRLSDSSDHQTAFDQTMDVIRGLKKTEEEEDKWSSASESRGSFPVQSTSSNIVNSSVTRGFSKTSDGVASREAHAENKLTKYTFGDNPPSTKQTSVTQIRHYEENRKTEKDRRTLIDSYASKPDCSIDWETFEIGESTDSKPSYTRKAETVKSHAQNNTTSFKRDVSNFGSVRLKPTGRLEMETTEKSSPKQQESKSEDFDMSNIKKLFSSTGHSSRISSKEIQPIEKYTSTFKQSEASIVRTNLHSNIPRSNLENLKMVKSNSENQAEESSDGFRVNENASNGFFIIIDDGEDTSESGYSVESFGGYHPFNKSKGSTMHSICESEIKSLSSVGNLTEPKLYDEDDEEEETKIEPKREETKSIVTKKRELFEKGSDESTSRTSTPRSSVEARLRKGGQERTTDQSPQREDRTRSISALKEKRFSQSESDTESPGRHARTDFRMSSSVGRYRGSQIRTQMSEEDTGSNCMPSLSPRIQSRSSSRQSVSLRKDILESPEPRRQREESSPVSSPRNRDVHDGSIKSDSFSKYTLKEEMKKFRESETRNQTTSDYSESESTGRTSPRKTSLFSKNTVEDSLYEERKYERKRHEKVNLESRTEPKRQERSENKEKLGEDYERENTESEHRERSERNIDKTKITEKRWVENELLVPGHKKESNSTRASPSPRRREQYSSRDRNTERSIERSKSPKKNEHRSRDRSKERQESPPGKRRDLYSSRDRSTERPSDRSKSPRKNEQDSSDRSKERQESSSIKRREQYSSRDRSTERSMGRSKSPRKTERVGRERSSEREESSDEKRYAERRITERLKDIPESTRQREKSKDYVTHRSSSRKDSDRSSDGEKRRKKNTDLQQHDKGRKTKEASPRFQRQHTEENRDSGRRPGRNSADSLGESPERTRRSKKPEEDSARPPRGHREEQRESTRHHRKKNTDSLEDSPERNRHSRKSEELERERLKRREKSSEQEDSPHSSRQDRNRLDRRNESQDSESRRKHTNSEEDRRGRHRDSSRHIESVDQPRLRRDKSSDRREHTKSDIEKSPNKERRRLDIRQRSREVSESPPSSRSRRDPGSPEKQRRELKMEYLTVGGLESNQSSDRNASPRRKHQRQQSLDEDCYASPRHRLEKTPQKSLDIDAYASPRLRVDKDHHAGQDKRKDRQSSSHHKKEERDPARKESSEIDQGIGKETSHRRTRNEEEKYNSSRSRKDPTENRNSRKEKRDMYDDDEIYESLDKQHHSLDRETRKALSESIRRSLNSNRSRSPAATDRSRSPVPPGSSRSPAPATRSRSKSPAAPTRSKSPAQPNRSPAQLHRSRSKSPAPTNTKRNKNLSPTDIRTKADERGTKEKKRNEGDLRRIEKRRSSEDSPDTTMRSRSHHSSRSNRPASSIGIERKSESGQRSVESTGERTKSRAPLSDRPPDRNKTHEKSKKTHSSKSRHDAPMLRLGAPAASLQQNVHKDMTGQGYFVDATTILSPRSEKLGRKDDPPSLNAIPNPPPFIQITLPSPILKKSEFSSSDRSRRHNQSGASKSSKSDNT